MSLRTPDVVQTGLVVPAWGRLDTNISVPIFNFCPIPGVHLFPAPPCPESKTPGTFIVTLTLHQCLCTFVILRAEGFYVCEYA